MRINRYVCVILSFFICQLASAASVEVKKGSLDKRIYHYQVLDNRLPALLISDPEADRAAAALDVNVGSYDDPFDREGLAHFLEHMLFLGTKKYPEADEYQSFISDSGGSHNAYTSRHHTNYFFEVDVNKLEPALDRFSQFFIAPLFDELYVTRERNIIHSEYQAKIRDDYRRGYDVYRSVVNPKHSDSKFSVGSLETLADRSGNKVRDDLLAFYKQHYYAGNMRLVVLGKESIAELQSMVVNRFKQIPQNPPGEQPTMESTPSLFGKRLLPIEMISQPVKQIREMSMNFELPSTQAFYKEKPLGFVGYILGHEGKGSLLSLLKREGLAEGLSAGGYDKGDGSSGFHVTVNLTKKGVEQRELIRTLLFHAVEQINEKGIEQWRYEEQRQLAQTAFHFREKSSSTNTVSHLASNLHDFPPEDIISGDYLIENYDPALIRRLLSYIKPENMYVSTVFPDAETDNVTKYYQVPYTLNSISTELKPLDKALTDQFALPEKNPFIAENISLYAKDPALATPVKLDSNHTIVNSEEDESTEESTERVLPLDDALEIVEGPANTENAHNLWAKQDVSFGTPKVKVQFRLLSPHVSGDLNGVATNALYIKLLQDKLNEYSYPALLAGASLSLSANNRGVDITLTGYHDKLHHLMALLIKEIDSGKIDADRFEQLKSDLIRDLKNTKKKTPYHQLYNHLVVNLYDLYWSNDARINALENVTLKDIEAFAKIWRQSTKVKGLFYGNLNQEWLKKWQPYVSRLHLPGDKPLMPARIVRLTGKNAQYDAQNVDHTDQAVALYVQGVNDSLEDRAAMSLLRQMMGSPFYNSLRTEQQLGYIVFMGSLSLKQVPGSVFIVQSPSTNVNDIRKAIETFIRNFEKQLPDDISTYQQAVIAQLAEAPTSLSASADDYWNNLIQDNETFDNRQRLIEAVKALDSQQIKRYYKQVFSQPSRLLWQFSRVPDAKGLIPFSTAERFYQYH